MSLDQLKEIAALLAANKEQLEKDAAIIALNAKLDEMADRIAGFEQVLNTLIETGANRLKKELSDDIQARALADLIVSRLYYAKEILTSDEVVRYLGISKSYLYKLTMDCEIPHYKPMGKLCYFNRAELDAWITQKRIGPEPV